MIAVFFYVLHVVAGGFLWEGYSHFHQPISDLTASGAPNRSLMLLFTTIYGILAVLFAAGFTVFETYKHHRLTYWGGIFFVMVHILSLSYNFFPQDLPGNPPTLAGALHLWVTVLIVPFTILAPIFIGLGFKKERHWEKFGIISLFTGGLIVIFGSLSGYFFSQKLPYFGLVERLNIGVLQLWTFYFSYKLNKNPVESSIK